MEITRLDTGPDFVRNVGQRQNEDGEMEDKDLPMDAVQAREPHHSSRARYPMPRTVSMKSNFPNFLRNVFTWTSIVRSATSPPSPQARFNTCSRVKTRPGCRTSSSRSLNSWAVKTISRVPDRTRNFSKSIV